MLAVVGKYGPWTVMTSPPSWLPWEGVRQVGMRPLSRGGEREREREREREKEKQKDREGVGGREIGKEREGEEERLA